MRQDKLFYDSAMHSIECAITDSPHSFEQVAVHLWPSKKMSTAYARLKACLNEDKDEKFSFEEIIEICKYCDRFDPLYFFADECMHHRGEPKAPEDEAALLKREFVAGIRSLDNLTKRLERLGVQL